MALYDTQSLQQKYERWCELKRQQEAAQKAWLEAEKLLKELQTYYQSPQWIQDHNEDVQVECANNEYCIINEDTLWDMLTDRDALAIRWMRLGLDTIERKG